MLSEPSDLSRPYAKLTGGKKRREAEKKLSLL
jgi:hypothetical protein